jgi:asparagine synthase (glutamine-hydrolysing)
VCGIIGFTGLYDKLTAKRMNAVLAHRGPDQDGFHFDADVALGNRRLKIIDLSEAGRQPMSNEGETVWVTFNGEIYNYRALRAELEARGHRFRSRADTEVLVHGFEEWGDALPKKLRGDFAFAVWDSRKKKIFLARDALGVCPLYYAFYDCGTAKARKGIVFASEIKALLLHPFVKRSVDYAALNEYLTLRYSLGPNTLFAGVKKLQPGSSLEFDVKSGEARTRTYWDFAFSESEARETEAFFIEKIRLLLQESVRLRLMSDVPLGAYLSGGLDSSFIVALMARAAADAGAPSDSVKTFSVGFGETTDETRFARLVAEECATNHKELSVDGAKALQSIPAAAWHLDEPIADIAAAPTFLMARAVKPHASVVLTGDGGDETFGGYARYSLLPRINRLAPRARAASHLAFLYRAVAPREVAARLRETLACAGDRGQLFVAYAAAFSEREKEGLCSERLAREMREAETPSVVDEVKPFFGGKSNADAYANELFYFDLKALLPDDYLMKVNKMSMAHSVESRVPYLDAEFVAFAATIPSELKVSGGHTKKIMRKAMQGFVPKEVIARGKWGFNVPTRAWLEGELGEIAAQMLGDEAVRERGWFENRFVQSVLRDYSRNERYYSRQFWALFALELWQRLFVDAPLEKIARPPKSFDEVI